MSKQYRDKKASIKPAVIRNKNIVNILYQRERRRLTKGFITFIYRRSKEAPMHRNKEASGLYWRELSMIL